MQAPRVPPWADAEPGDSERERARAEEDDAGELTPLVLVLGVLLLVGVILMALVGVNAIGGSGVASGSDLSQPTHWDDEPAKVTTGAPRNDIAIAVSVASPTLGSDPGDRDPDLVVVDLARTSMEPDQAQDTPPSVADVQTAEEDTPAVDAAETKIEDVVAEVVDEQPVALQAPTTVEAQSLLVTNQSGEEPDQSSPQAVPLSVTATTAPQAEPDPPASTSLATSGPKNDSLVDPLTTTTVLVARGLDIGGLAVDIGETTAILHWQVAGPTEEISGLKCAGPAAVKRLPCNEWGPLSGDCSSTVSNRRVDT